MQLYFNQYLTARTAAFADDLKTAKDVGFDGVELFFDTCAKALSSGAGLLSYANLVKDLGFETAGAGSILLAPEATGTEESQWLVYDQLTLLGELFKRFYVPLCSVDPYICSNDDELNLHPLAATREYFEKTLSGFTRDFTYIGFGLCPDCDPLSLVNTVSAAYDIIYECANAKLSLILDAGRLDEKSLGDISKLPSRAISLIRLGADIDFNKEFLKEIAKTGFDGGCSVSQTLMGAGDNAETIREGYDLLKSSFE